MLPTGQHLDLPAEFAQFWALTDTGVGLDRIRRDLLASSAAKAAGATSFSAHDIMCAAQWVFRWALSHMHTRCSTNVIPIYRA